MKPHIELNAGAIPDELRLLARWVVWKLEVRSGKATKVPYRADGSGRASSTDPDSWSTYDLAVRAHGLGGYSGIGIVLGDTGNGVHLSGVDLDKCRDQADGSSPDWVHEIIAKAMTYTEVSPSGTGYKLLLWGQKPHDSGNRTHVNIDGDPDRGGESEVEVYDNGRYFTITGHIHGGRDAVSNGKEFLAWLCDRLGLSGKTVELPTVSPGKGGIEDDETLLRSARAAENGATFSGLFDAGIHSHGGRSEAVMDLLIRLAFWTGKDADQMDRLFRRSALYSEKWDRADGNGSLGSKEIARAISFQREVYLGPKARGYREHVESLKDSDGKPAILITTDTEAMARQLDSAMASESPIRTYQMAGELVRIDRQDGPPDKAPRKIRATRGVIRGAATTVASWIKVNQDGDHIDAAPPKAVIDAYYESGQWSQPPLTGIITAPMMRADGSILYTPGYDATTGLYLDTCGVSYRPLPPRPTRQQASEAVDRLLEPVSQFPFAQPSDRSAYLAMLLTVVARRAILGPVPGFPIGSCSKGTGKTLLADICSMIATGSTCPRMVHTANEEEARKRIATFALAAKPMLLIDNVKTRLGGEAIEAALTGDRIEDRRLGTMDTISAPWRSVLAFTGNGLTYSDDIVRRVVPVTIDAQIEHPSRRVGFRIEDPVSWCRARRGTLVTDALTVVSAYHRAGHPKALGGYGSFESWSRVIRSAIVWAGQPDPNAGAEQLEDEGNLESSEYEMLLRAIYAREGDNKFRVNDLLSEVYEEDSQSKKSREIRQGIEAFTGAKKPSSRALGKILGAAAGKPRGGESVGGGATRGWVRVDRAGKIAGYYYWRVTQDESKIGTPEF